MILARFPHFGEGLFMTAPALMTKDKEKLVPMSGEEIEGFLKEYKEWVGANIQNEITGYLADIESYKKKISDFRKEWKEIESSDFLPEIKNRNRARIEQNILIEEDEIKRIASRIKILSKCRREFTTLKFLRPMLLGLLENGFYRFGFTSLITGEAALAGWTNFVEVESMKHNFAAQTAIPTSFLLGYYRVEIAMPAPLRRFLLPIKIYNLDQLSSSTFPHPHVNESSDPCFGDFITPIQKCFEEKRFLHVFHLIRIFLSSYSLNLLPGGLHRPERRPYASALIEYWPEKGSDKPPGMPSKERTGSYDG